MMITNAILQIYDRQVNPNLLIRRLTIGSGNVVADNGEANANKMPLPTQLDLFTDTESLERENDEINQRLSKEKKMQEALVDIKKRYGKNAILKGLNFEEGATTRDRNNQIGGHKA